MNSGFVIKKLGNPRFVAVSDDLYKPAAVKKNQVAKDISANSQGDRLGVEFTEAVDRFFVVEILCVLCEDVSADVKEGRSPGIRR